MKKINFDKVTKYGVRQVVGYVIKHSCHPNRQFVICRGTKTYNDASYKVLDNWAVYDRTTGVQIPGFGIPKTRKEMEETLLTRLYKYTPEAIQLKVENQQLRIATHILTGEPT